ncbi:hypothetical protein M2352_004349 [Azospirillum fermentarium]|uniref:phage tail protein n=1 Tax=Azospirillum fermentarium TaxID=1233114 RepID=UPI0022264179|nr:phage tail protein [Azospirillum fermentarium]MCW2248689.1 hypothetical protein [Azospirillum fermentarium]
MADLRFPLPPPFVGDRRFQSLALAVEDEIGRIRARLPALRVRVIDEVSDPGILAHLAWQFHVMGVEGWDFVPDTVEAKRDLIKDAIELHRYKGTRWAVETALSRVLKLDAVVEEADVFRRTDGHWAEYQIDSGRVLGNAEERALMRVAPAWAPARSRLVRVYHGYDLRAARYDLPSGGNTLMLDDWSGIDVDGVRFSFSTPFGGEMPAADTRPVPGWGHVPGFGAAYVIRSGLRYDDNAVDGENDPALVRPGIVVVSAWPVPDRTGHPPAFRDRASLAAGVKDGMAHGDVNAVWDIPTVWRMTGDPPCYDQGPGTVPAAWHLDVLATLHAPVTGDVLAAPPRPVLPAFGVAVSVGVAAGRVPACFDAPLDDRHPPVWGQPQILGAVLARSFVSWGTGPWTEQPWGAATADFMMEVVE